MFLNRNNNTKYVSAYMFHRLHWDVSTVTETIISLQNFTIFSLHKALQFFRIATDPHLSHLVSHPHFYYIKLAGFEPASKNCAVGRATCDGNWSSFQLANSTSPLSVTDSAIAPSARMKNIRKMNKNMEEKRSKRTALLV